MYICNIFISVSWTCIRLEWLLVFWCSYQTTARNFYGMSKFKQKRLLLFFSNNKSDINVGFYEWFFCLQIFQFTWFFNEILLSNLHEVLMKQFMQHFRQQWRYMNVAKTGQVFQDFKYFRMHRLLIWCKDVNLSCSGLLTCVLNSNMSIELKSYL